MRHRAPSCDAVRPLDPRFGVAPRIFPCEELRIETELCRFGGLKFWSPYVCPIWLQPEFQAAKATQLRVNSRPEILVAICLPDLGATRISGRQSDTARCQFEAARTKIARRNPKSGIPVLTAPGRVMCRPPQKGRHMSAVATNPEMLVAPNARENAPKVLFRPATENAPFVNVPVFRAMLQSKSGKRTKFTQIHS